MILTIVTEQWNAISLVWDFHKCTTWKKTVIRSGPPEVFLPWMCWSQTLPIVRSTFPNLLTFYRLLRWPQNLGSCWCHNGWARNRTLSKSGTKRLSSSSLTSAMCTYHQRTFGKRRPAMCTKNLLPLWQFGSCGVVLPKRRPCCTTVAFKTCSPISMSWREVKMGCEIYGERIKRNRIPLE